MIISAYFITMNAIGFIVMGIDKLLAKKNFRRIPEATLFAIALFGGSGGTTLGMFLFRHKTKHWYFRFGMPAILIIQLTLAYIVIKHPPIPISIL